MRNKLFIIIFLLFIFGIPSLIIIREPKEFSVIENRKLEYFEFNSFKGILNGDIQDNVENSFSDQMFLGQTLKKIYNYLKTTNRNLTLDFISWGFCFL